jgi:hypothetical protein
MIHWEITEVFSTFDQLVSVYQNTIALIFSEIETRFFEGLKLSVAAFLGSDTHAVLVFSSTSGSKCAKLTSCVALAM